MTSQRDKNAAFNIVLAVVCVIMVAVSVLALIGKSVARNDDFRLRGAEMDIIHTEDRLQKQINDLELRVKALESRP